MTTRSWGYAYVDSPSGTPVRYSTVSPGQREVSVYPGRKFASKPGVVVNGAALLTTGVVIGIVLAILSNGN